MHEAESLDDGRREDRLLRALTETARALEAVRRLRDHRKGGPGRGGGDAILGGSGEDGEEEEEEECMQKVLGALRELSVSHSDRVAGWREALTECARMLAKCPPEGSVQQHPSATDRECKVLPCSDSFSDTFISVGEDVQNVMDKLSTVVAKLDKEILKCRTKEASTVDAALQETRDPKASEQRETDRPEQDVEDGGRTTPSPDTEQASDSRLCSSVCDDVEEEGKELAKSQGSDDDEKEEVSQNRQADFVEETSEKVKGKEETNKEWIIVGLTGRQEDRRSDVPDACFIRAAPGAAEVLRCEVADTLSCLIVSGSEELVSRVVRVKIQDGAHLHFPVTVVVPFCARYRGSYRDVAVKIVDGEGRTSYVTPVTSEGTYGGQRGSFAEVRVYSLGLFAVVSCLKRENYTVPTKGLSLKLPMDPRICLNYLPGSFAVPVMAQTMIQPVDAALLAAVKSRSDAYHSVASTSPVLYLTHPSSQPLRRSLTVTLPCPPNPGNKRHTKGPGEAPHRPRPFGASPPRDQPASHGRTLMASLKSTERSDELLIALGSRDKQWSVLDKVPVRSLQNGLVSFEVAENFESFMATGAQIYITYSGPRPHIVETILGR